MDKKDTPHLHDRLIRQRIRNRRAARGMTARELAERAGISASYLSLIENGSKLPSEGIAMRIAEALDDDDDLYRAWVQAGRYPNLAAHVERLLRLERVGRSPELRARMGRGERIEDDDGQFDMPAEEPRVSRTRFRCASERERRLARLTLGEEEEETRFASSDSILRSKLVEMRQSSVGDLMAAHTLGSDTAPIVPVPLLADGSDPGDDPAESDGLIEHLNVDSRFLPPGVERPFAYRPAAAAVERVRRVIRPGDVVVLAARPQSVVPSGVYAVRHRGRVILSRVVRHGTVLLLLPSDDGGRPVPIESRDEQQLVDRLAGVVVTTIRSWDSPAPAGEPAPRPKPRGRSVRLEGDFLVRDCHWKERYGWRPIQRPEDLDYLEAHSGTQIRFRLIQDGRVRYLLEMSPEQWRRALGRYVDGPSWRRNGYIVAITRRRAGEYTTEFQDRWAGYVREAGETGEGRS